MPRISREEEVQRLIDTGITSPTTGARMLGIHPATFTYYLEKLGCLDRSQKDIDNIIAEAIKLQPLSMSKAAKQANLPFGTFKHHAKRLGLYCPNPNQEGVDKVSRTQVPSILGKRTEGNRISAGAIKRRLVRLGIKDDRCEACGQEPTWNGQPLVLHLDHIDGDKHNWELSNLKILCPNCHTQTPTFAGRNKFQEPKLQ